MRHLIIVFLGIVGFVFTGCGTPNEELTRDSIDLLKEIADELSTIKDAASAEATAPHLRELGDRWRANKHRINEQKGTDRREMKWLEKKYGGQYESAVNRYWLEVDRVERIPGGKQALSELGRLIEPLAKGAR
jgi:hypothetical protein